MEIIVINVRSATTTGEQSNIAEDVEERHQSISYYVDSTDTKIIQVTQIQNVTNVFAFILFQ